MKKFITILIVLLTLNTYSQETETKIPDITQTERIIDKYSGKITEGFNNIVKDVTPLAEEGFNMVVKLQIAKGAVFTIGFIICIAILIFLLYKWNYFYENDLEVGAFFGIILIIIPLPFLIYQGLTHLLAPEWFAIKEILNLI